MAESETALNERAQRLLKVLVEKYICSGQPVGSRTLARDSGLDLSPATIRNVMADLEEMGLITAPHTSAGRVPTVQGYRLFVDTLVTTQPLQGSTLRQLKMQLKPDGMPETLVKTASSLLSGLTQMAGVVTLPRHEQIALHQLEFLPLNDNRVLVILVTNNHEVQNRVICTSKAFTRDELQQAANYLNAQFAGKGLAAIKQALLAELKETKERADQLMLDAINIASAALNATPEKGDYVLAGETNLMGFTELYDVEKLRQLFEAFNQKRDILHLLDAVLRADGVHIFIGEESGYQAFDTCSMVTAPYRINSSVVGVLGVIGPTRMAYDQVIPLVDVTAKLLGSALNQ